MEDGLLRTFHAGLADPILARQRQAGAFHVSNLSGIGLGLKVIVSFLVLSSDENRLDPIKNCRASQTGDVIRAMHGSVRIGVVHVPSVRAQVQSTV